jgi:hypothetical protein
VDPDRLAGRRLYGRTFGAWVLAAGLAFGAFFLVVGGSAPEEDEVPGVRLLVSLLAGGVLAVHGTALLLVPLVVLGGEALEMRSSPWRRARVVAAWDLEWRSGAAYVGRYLFRRDVTGTSARFPLWLLSRGDQRALFAWLDARHVADRPAGKAQVP